MSRVNVRIPAPLRPMVGGAAEVAVEGETVGEVLQALGAAHSGLLDRILDPEGQPRAFVNLYLDDKNVRSLNGIESAVTEGATLHIVPAVAGGRR